MNLPKARNPRFITVRRGGNLQEIADATGIALADLLTALNLPADTDPGTAVRDRVEAGLIDEVDQARNAVVDLQA